MGNFVVWMPLIPLDVRVSDNKLSQIKGWRVPFLPKRLSPFGDFTDNSAVGSMNENRFDFLDQQMLLDESVPENEKYWTASASSSSSSTNSCRVRFQQTRVEVYTRFLSTDHNSGREASLLNRRHSHHSSRSQFDSCHRFKGASNSWQSSRGNWCGQSRCGDNFAFNRLGDWL